VKIIWSALALVAAVSVLTGCGGADEPTACSEITSVIADGTQALRDASEDPSAAQAAFQDLADEMRTAAEAAGPVVKAAAEALADRYDRIASGIDTGQLPEVDELTDATTALASACQS
jgi:hypothetical protein